MKKVKKLVKINEEYHKLLPFLPCEEYKALKDSIIQNGLHFPIVVNGENVILDGYNRYKICNELGIEPKFEVKYFDNPLLEKQFVIEANLRRRHLNKFQRVEMAKPLLEIEKELAKQRQGTRTDLKPTSGSNEHKVQRARDIIAREIGVSSTINGKGKDSSSSNELKLSEEVNYHLTS